LKQLRKILAILLLTTVTCVKTQAQYYSIPDTNFRNYLISLNSNLFNADKKLNIAEAKNFNTYISCQGLNIRSLSGLEYFHKVYLINCSDNPLQELPSLDSLGELMHLYTENCSISKFPDLSRLSKLQNFTIKNNRITLIPELKGLEKLEYFDCSINDIKTLPDLSELVSLQKLYCFDNELENLPDLKNLANLQVLDCPGNRLTLLPSLAANTNLQVLRCGYNLLKSLPPLSHMTNLKELSVEHNRLTRIPDVTGNQQLQILNVSLNRLNSLPDISRLNALTRADISNNLLGFASLVPLTAHPLFNSVFTVVPQDTILNYPVTELAFYSAGQILAGIDEGIDSDRFEWYKDEIFLKSTTTPYFTIDTVTLKDAGLYLTRVTNTTPALSGITLIVRSARVTTGPCINASQLQYTITSEKCNEGVSVEFSDEKINSPFRPFTYTIESVPAGRKYTSESNKATGILPGTYTIRISDKNKCSVMLSTPLLLSPAADCDNIITPNGDGVDDVYFIQNSGTVRILSKEGRIVKELQVPAEWDGTDHSGTPVPLGFYTLLINNRDKVGIIVLN
jgi:internalin A